MMLPPSRGARAERLRPLARQSTQRRPRRRRRRQRRRRRRRRAAQARRLDDVHGAGGVSTTRHLPRSSPSYHVSHHDSTRTGTGIVRRWFEDQKCTSSRRHVSHTRRFFQTRRVKRAFEQGSVSNDNKKRRCVSSAADGRSVVDGSVTHTRTRLSVSEYGVPPSSTRRASSEAQGLEMTCRIRIGSLQQPRVTAAFFPPGPVVPPPRHRV